MHRLGALVLRAPRACRVASASYRFCSGTTNAAEAAAAAAEAAAPWEVDPSGAELASRLERCGIERQEVCGLLDRNKFLQSSHLEEVEANIAYMESIGIGEEEFPWLFTKFPDVLRPGLKQRWKPFMDVLEEYEVLRPAVKRLLKHFCGALQKLPQVYFMQPLTYFNRELELPAADISRILKSHPEVLLLDFDKTIASKVEFLHRHGVKGADVARVFCRNPSIVGHSIDNLNQKIDYLLSIGVRPLCVKKIVVAFPSILSHSIENKMKPAVALLEQAGVSGAHLKKLVTSKPAIFAIDVKMKLPMVLDNLKDFGPEGIVLILSWGISEGIGAMEQRVRYLRSLGFQNDELVKMISRDPRILKISRMGMDVKLKYLTGEMGMSKDILLKNPTFLYSHLDRRIKIRYEVLSLLHQKGVLPKPPELTQIMYPSNQDFMERYVNPYPECITIVKKHQQMIERDEERQKSFLLQYAPPEKPLKKKQLRKMMEQQKK